MVDACHVDTDDPEEDQSYGVQEQSRRDEGNPPRRAVLSDRSNEPHDDVEEVGDAEDEGRPAGDESNVQRYVREAEELRRHDGKAPPEAVMRVAGSSARSGVWDDALAEPDPRSESSIEPVTLGQGSKGFEWAPVEQ